MVPIREHRLLLAYIAMRQERPQYNICFLYIGPPPLNRDGQSLNTDRHSRKPQRKLPQTPSSKGTHYQCIKILSVCGWVGGWVGMWMCCGCVGVWVCVSNRSQGFMGLN